MKNLHDGKLSERITTALIAVVTGSLILGWVPVAVAETEVRVVRDFHAIEFAAPGELTLSRSDSDSLALDAAPDGQTRFRLPLSRRCGGLPGAQPFGQRRGTGTGTAK